MSKAYDLYITNHRDLAKLSWYVLKTFYPVNKYLSDKQIENMIKMLDEHDSSKFEYDEYYAYDAYFYGKERTDKVVNDFNKAFLLHIHRNPHHWQYWVLPKDSPDDEEIAIEMPEEYVFEMLCDWWSFSWKQKNPLEIISWYNDRKDFIKLHSRTRYIVESVLHCIENNFRRDYE